MFEFGGRKESVYIWYPLRAESKILDRYFFPFLALQDMSLWTGANETHAAHPNDQTNSINCLTMKSMLFVINTI